MKGYAAFQSAYLGTDQTNLDNFEDFAARKLRYSLLWAMNENNAYDKLNAWSQLYKSEYQLYEHIRGIYNPAYRLGEFWKSHLWGGMLDPGAGDGKEIKSALPIIADNKSLRPAISQIWKWSNWQVKKDVFSLWGTTFGDGIIIVKDIPAVEKVYMSLVHPSQIADIVLDDWGNVKGYVIEEERQDPRRNDGAKVMYQEVAYRDGENVVYETYLDNELYPWDGDSATWDVPYGFVPMVFVKHNDVGLNFGWSEMHPDLGKFREIDDQASKLHDQIRKVIAGGWLMAGMSAPSDDEEQEDRESENMIWTTNSEAKAQSLVNDIDIPAVSSNIKQLLEELERDYPELNSDLHNVSGDISGRALRINRAPVEAKVQQRRPNYDNALVRAQQMAVAIAGWRRYKGFEGFDLTSYQRGNLDHSIGERPVFAKDPLDDTEIQSAFWAAAAQAKSAGMPLESFLEDNGWTAERISKVSAKIAENRKKLMQEADFFSGDQNSE
ncbi:MAG: hypothetical protein IPL32_18165 [Chloracidobacterium sp.]|nr:hypothetical protein [Chloracidobacterium sp.]